jgi:hypothetical protein
MLKIMFDMTRRVLPLTTSEMMLDMMMKCIATFEQVKKHKTKEKASLNL